MKGAAVLVVGAGPTGLVLALALARAGVRVRIIDARSGIARQSRALDVQARTMELYRQLGVADGLLERGVQIQQMTVRDRGREVATVDVSGFGRRTSRYPYILCCPQDDHEALLVHALAEAGVDVEWQTELTSLRNRGEQVEVTIAGPDGREAETTFAYACGCDGAGSTVREQLCVEFGGGTSEQRFFVADVTASGPGAASAERGSFTFCLSANDFVLVVPARRTDTSRLIGLVPAGLPGGQELGFDDLREVAERATALRAESVHWFSTYQVSHRIADRFQVGRAFLLGDAGHVHSPLGGQGMNTGIGDAVNLAWKLAAVLQGRADTSLVDTYEPERLAFARSLVTTTDRLFTLVAGVGPGRRIARRLLFRGLLPGLLRWPVTRTALIGRISQVRLRYRMSALSRGRAGRVRGGDRLPWVELGDGHDNFEPLASLDWQVHVYGRAGVELREVTGDLGLALHEFAWTRRTRRAGLCRDAAYLVRPDGYVALADPRQSVERLRDLVTSYGMGSR